jgi:arabinose-5-phosphate isomerase
MLKQLLSNGKQHLDYFFENVDLSIANDILQTLHNCQGFILLTGVGKSEIMAKKIANTMTSTGTRALFIPSSNALHGDIGVVTDKDVFIAFSKSGESEELLNLVPFVRERGAKLIAVVSNPNNRLSRACDMSMVLPLERELCPFDLAPTISTQTQMIFGDLMTVGLMNLKKFSLDEYAKNHPAGKLGRRVAVKVKDLMITGNAVPTCRPDDKLFDILVILSQKRCGCVLIADESHHLQGIFTDGDLGRVLNSIGTEALQLPMHKLMTKSPRCIDPEALAWEAVKSMESDRLHPITVLAVVDQSKKLFGIIKMHDILQAGI